MSYKQPSSPANLEVTSWKNRDLSLREYDTSQTAFFGQGVKVEASNHSSPVELARYRADWLHCSTMLNVADDLTKGILVEEMNGRWFNGPKFLQQGEEFWPVEQGTLDFKEVNKEKRKGQITRPASVNTVIDCKKFSTWK